MANLRKLVELLGPAVTGLHIPQAVPTTTSGGRALILDAQNASEAAAGDVLLAVQVAHHSDILNALRRAGESGAAALLVKQRDGPDAELVRQADTSRCALITLDPHASWTQVYAWIARALEAEAFERGKLAASPTISTDLNLSPTPPPPPSPVPW